MEIIRQVQELIWWVVRQALQFIAFVLWAASFPVVLLVLPVVLICHNPRADYSLMGEVFFWAAPWSCAFYMAMSVHSHSVRQWKREGRDVGVFAYKWREAHGGMFCTLVKSSVYMFGALFASYVLGFFYLFAWHCVPLHQPAKLLLGFEFFPLAAYAPVILLWVTRWLRGSEVQ
jgi:hypothetical protein